MKQLLSFLLLAFLIPSVCAQTTTWSEVKIQTTPAVLEQLSNMGLPLEEGFHAKDGSWTTILSAQELVELQRLGVKVEVIHTDYSKFIQDRNRAIMQELSQLNHRKDLLKQASSTSYPVPQHFRYGEMGGFLTLQEVMSQLDSMRLLYPNLISPRASAGNTTTIEGRSINYVFISNNPNQITNKPKVLYGALIHAREPMGMQQLIYFMWYLLENYESSVEIKYLVDNLQLFFIPVMNPDGYEYNHSISPFGGGSWRKNRRDNGNGYFGVDINRNFGFKWGYDNTGSSGDPAEETYRGSSPFSEPETQVIRDFCTQHHFNIIQNYHTYSDYTLYPWCYINANTPDSLVFNSFARFITKENGYMMGHPGEILYTTNGDALDWQYGEQVTKQKEICFTSEIGEQSDGFWPYYDRIIPLAQENMYSNLIIAHLALRYAEVHDASPVILSNRLGKFGFEFMRYGMDGPADYTVTLRPVDASQFLMWGGPKVFQNPAQVTSYIDSVEFELVSTVTSGDQIKLVYEIENGLYTYRDTIVKFYGPPLVVFSDSCNSMNNWTSTKWNVTTSKYHSAPSSITDSPSGNYGNNANATITSSSIDLKGSPVAVINYWARWRTEIGYDYSQFRLRGNSGSWIPQKGLFTKTSFYLEADHEPIYDGNQSNWIKEQIVTTDFTNLNLGMQFLLKSDLGATFDGFYFDDVTVTVVDMSYVGVPTVQQDRIEISSPMPNPARKSTTIHFYQQSANPFINATFQVADIRGVVLIKHPIQAGERSIEIDVSALEPGIYLYWLNTSTGSSDVKKLTVIN